MTARIVERHMERLHYLLPAMALAALAGCAGTAAPPQNAAAKPVATTGTIEASAANATLLDTTWKILSMAGEPVKTVEGRRMPQIVLKSADGRDSWSATVGCNQMSGGLAVDGERVDFKSGMSTLMACPPPLDVLEKQLGKSLLASTRWRIQGNRLELRDDAGVQTFLCEAAHSE
jgi:heat shock protein HslJ